MRLDVVLCNSKKYFKSLHATSCISRLYLNSLHAALVIFEVNAVAPYGSKLYFKDLHAASNLILKGLHAAFVVLKCTLCLHAAAVVLSVYPVAHPCGSMHL